MVAGSVVRVRAASVSLWGLVARIMNARWFGLSRIGRADTPLLVLFYRLAPHQDAHPLPALRSPFFPQSEEHLQLLRLPRSQDQEV